MQQLCQLAIGFKSSSKSNKIEKNENNNLKSSTNLNYSGKFLNTEDEFKKPEELFLFRDEIMKDLLVNKLIKMKFSELRTPPEEENEENFKKFIEFAKINGVRIYSREDVTYKTEGLREDYDLDNKIKNIHPFLKDLCKKKNSI